MRDESDNQAGFKAEDDRNATPGFFEELDGWAKILAPLVKLPGFTTTVPDQPGIAFQWDNVYAEPPTAPEKPITKRPDQPEPPHGRRSPGPGSGPIATRCTPTSSDKSGGRPQDQIWCYWQKAKTPQTAMLAWGCTWDRLLPVPAPSTLYFTH